MHHSHPSAHCRHSVAVRCKLSSKSESIPIQPSRSQSLHSQLSVPSIGHIRSLSSESCGSVSRISAVQFISSTCSGHVQPQSCSVFQSFRLVQSTYHSCRGSAHGHEAALVIQAIASSFRWVIIISRDPAHIAVFKSVACLHHVHHKRRIVPARSCSTLSMFIKSSTFAGQIKTTSSNIGGAASLQSEHLERHGS